MSADKVISLDEVSKKTAEDGAWIVIEGGVYDVTEFLDEHPGGKKILLRSCGKDATNVFWKYHSKKVLNKTAKSMKIGTVGEKSKL